MKQRVALFGAALAAGAWAFGGYDQSAFAQDRDREVSGQVQVGDAKASAKMELPAGITRSDRTDQAGIRRTLGGAVEAVLSQDNFTFNSLNPYLASNDRMRFANAQADNQRLNQKIQQLRAAFQDKYNQDFDIREEVVFGDQFRGMEIVQGEVSNPALLSNWPIERRTSAGGSRTDTDTRVRTEIRTEGQERGGHKAEPSGPGSPGTLKEDEADAGRQRTTVDRDTAAQATDTDRQRDATVATLDRGMNVAIVTFPQSHGAPEFDVSLVREGAAARGADADRRDDGVRVDADLASPDWKMDVPSSITALQLQNNLEKHIDQVLSMRDRWPADATEGYRAISHHVLYAFYDTASSARGGAIDRTDRTGTDADRGDKAEPSGPGSPGTLRDNR